MHSIRNGKGKWVNLEAQIQQAFVNFYKESQGKELLQICKVRNMIIDEVYEYKFRTKLTNEQQSLLECNFNISYVKRVLWSIPNDKAPGLDALNSILIGEYIAGAIIDFFQTWKLLKSINLTSVTLIPKVRSLAHVSDYRPIA